MVFRQIHMDFHTSEKINTIGERFDQEEFAETLKEAHVNSVTCFSRCHHGQLYYQSLKFPHLIHPGLKEQTLLEGQIEACHKRGIKVPVYTTVQWDYYISKNHPEWCCLTENGAFVDSCERELSKIYEPGFYRTLCVNTPYRSYLKAQIEDLFLAVGKDQIDGIFLDIVNLVDCSCHHCVSAMVEEGYEPTRKEERVKYAHKMLQEFKHDMTSFIRNFSKDCSIFYNSGHIGPAAAAAKDAYSHFELESLPSGIWGYSHFVNTVRYARTLGKDYLSQTGKFHGMWGDFHSFKNLPALQYECFRMLAYGSKCMIGDQLDPDGKISKDVYQLVGQVYQEIERKEPWCDDVKEVVDIAILSGEFMELKAQCGGSVSSELNGVCAMLDELGYQFNIIDDKSNLNNYKVVILPDTIVLDHLLAEKLEIYVKEGGSLIASFRSGFQKENMDQVALSCLGIEGVGLAPYQTDFFLPTEKLGIDLPKTEHVMYLQGMEVKSATAEVLADTYIPYFDRTWEHFCSHLHTPSSHQRGYPFATQNLRSIYFMHPIFTIYAKKHPRWCKLAVKDALERLLEQPVIKHNGPTTLVTTLNEQLKEGQYVFHALHYIPVKAAEELYTIEDVIPLHHINISIRADKPISKVLLVPEQKEIPYLSKDGRVEFELETIDGHTMVALIYKEGYND